MLLYLYQVLLSLYPVLLCLYMVLLCLYLVLLCLYPVLLCLYLVFLSLYPVIHCLYPVLLCLYLVLLCPYPVLLCLYPVLLSLYPVLLCLYPVLLCLYPVLLCLYPVLLCLYPVLLCLYLVLLCLYPVLLSVSCTPLSVSCTPLSVSCTPLSISCTPLFVSCIPLSVSCTIAIPPLQRTAVAIGDGNNEEEMLGAAEDVEAELVHRVCEQELLHPVTSLLGSFLPLIVTVCQDPQVFSCPVLQTSAALALAKFMLIRYAVCMHTYVYIRTLIYIHVCVCVDCKHPVSQFSSKFCDQNLQLLFTILEKVTVYVCTVHAVLTERMCLLFVVCVFQYTCDHLMFFGPSNTVPSTCDQGQHYRGPWRSHFPIPKSN